MEITISSAIKIKYPTPEVEKWCDEHLMIDNPLYAMYKKQGNDFMIRKFHLKEKTFLYTRGSGYITLPFGCLRGIWSLIKNSTYSLTFNDNPDISLKDEPCAIEMYDYQIKAIEKMISAKGGVLVSPCGSGKTYMGIEIVRRIHKPFLWLVHTGDLLRQAQSDFLELYPNMDIGIISEGDFNVGKDGAIATVQTLTSIDKKQYQDLFDVVVCDECAHTAGTPEDTKMFKKIMENIPARYKFGLTATPHRSDGLIKSMYTIIGMSVDGRFKPTYKVPRSAVKTIPAYHKMIMIDLPFDEEETTDPNPKDKTERKINFNKLTKYLSNDDERNKIIIDNVIDCAKQGRKQIVLSKSVEHCKKLYQAFLDAGLNAKITIGATTVKKRKEALLAENGGDWEVLVATYALLKEGVSIKQLDTLHMTTPLVDEAMVEQCVGRIERYLDNKKQPIAFDYVDMNSTYCLNRYYKRKKILTERFNDDDTCEVF